MGEHTQPPGTACHSTALLPLPTQLHQHQRGGVQGMWTGDDGDWGRPVNIGEGLRNGSVVEWGLEFVGG